MKEYIVCYLYNDGSADFTDPKTEKEALKYIKKEKVKWFRYYLTKIINHENKRL